MRNCCYTVNNINPLSVEVCIICAFTSDGVWILFWWKWLQAEGVWRPEFWCHICLWPARWGSFWISVCLAVKWDGNFSLIKNTWKHFAKGMIGSSMRPQIFLLWAKCRMESEWLRVGVIVQKSYPQNMGFFFVCVWCDDSGESQTLTLKFMKTWHSNPPGACTKGWGQLYGHVTLAVDRVLCLEEPRTWFNVLLPMSWNSS